MKPTNEEIDIEKVISSNSTLRKNTKRQYIFRLNKLQNEHNINVLDIKSVNNWLNNLSPFTQSTKKQYYVAIKKVYELLDMKEEMRKLDIIKYNSKKKRLYLTKNQVKKLLNSIKSEKIWLIVRLLIETGVRNSIIVNLKPIDIDFEENILLIPAQYEGNKMDEIYRTNMTDELSERLNRYIQKNKIQLKEPIFKFNWKNKQTQLGRIVQKQGQNIGLGWVTPHVLRHTFGTHYYAGTKDLISTRDAMGQKYTQSTERYTENLESIKKGQEKMLKDMGL